MQHPIILFDGECTLCNGFVQFVIAHDPQAIFRFSSLQSDFGQTVVQQYGISSFDSIVLFEGNAVFLYSDAVLRVCSRFGGIWTYLTYILCVIPQFFRDFFYKIVAKNRYHFFGKRDICLLPNPELMARFITTS